MIRTAIVTDSSSGLTQNEREKLNITVVNIPYIINGEEYIENVNLTREQFFEMQAENANISTSQPSQIAIKEVWDNILKDYDELVYIPLSSGLSASCNTAELLSEQYLGKVQVIDNKRVSVTLKGSLYIAHQLIKEGKSAKEVKDYLESDTFNSSIYITVPTLKHLRKGGRVTAAAAAIGNLFKIKPVLQIQGDKLDAFSKVITMNQAKNKMVYACQKDLETRFKRYRETNEMVYAIAYSHLTNEEALIYAKEIGKAFPDLKFTFVDSLPLSIISHTGPDCLAVAMFKSYNNCFENIY